MNTQSTKMNPWHWHSTQWIRQLSNGVGAAEGESSAAKSKESEN